MILEQIVYDHVLYPVWSQWRDRAYVSLLEDVEVDPAGAHQKNSSLVKLSPFTLLAHCLISYGTLRKYGNLNSSYLKLHTDTVNISTHVLRTSTK